MWLFHGWQPQGSSVWREAQSLVVPEHQSQCLDHGQVVRAAAVAYRLIKLAVVSADSEQCCQPLLVQPLVRTTEALDTRFGVTLFGITPEVAVAVLLLLVPVVLAVMG